MLAPLSFSRRRGLAAAAASLLLPLDAARAQNDRPGGIMFRIGTGGVSGAYFALGSALAGALSEPPGSPRCRRVSDCGIEGLVATAQSSAGSVENVQNLESGAIESGFVQSDVAYMAREGLPPFKGHKADDLRALAALYSESLHLAVRGGDTADVAKALRGRRVAVDEEGSGTLSQVRLLLKAFNLNEKDFHPFYIKPAAALAMMREQRLDAMFVTGGVPMSAVQEAVATQAADLVPIAGAKVDALVKQYPFLTTTVIPATAYGLAHDTPTIGVTAQWLVSAKLDDALASALVRVLFQKRTMDALGRAHPRGADINPSNAFSGVTVPMHDGALRFYREQGLAPADVR